MHCSVDRSGEYLLTAYNYPSNITVHRIKPDGTLGEQVAPREKLDVGIFAHQVLTTPGNRTAIMVTRGNNPEADKPEDPGALKVYGFKDGVLSQPRFDRSAATALASARAISTFIPNKPWLFLSVERQSELHVYRLNDDGTLPRDAMFIKNALADRANHVPHARWRAPSTSIRTAASSTMTNRNSGTEEIGGRKVFKGGENNVAVFSIDPATRRADADPEHRGADHSSAHLRHRSERPPADRGQHPADGDARRLDAAGGARALSHRRRRQARRSRARYDVDTGRFMQFWTGIVTLP